MRRLPADYQIKLMIQTLRLIFIAFTLFIATEPFLQSTCFAVPASRLRQNNPELQIPARLRPRVNFWIDIFGKYTKAQVIIHHRRFPQIRFALLDISKETAGVNNVVFDSYKDRALKALLKEVREDIAYLATGEAPKTQQQRNIEQAMRVLGPGVSKYQRIVNDSELVRGQSGISDKTAEAVQRSGRYLPIIEGIFVDEFQLPVELTRLPFVESSFDYRAYSTVAAAGIWQFMPKTALSYMRVGPTLDERLDPIESSRAAAKYLRSAYSRLGTWPLALTSYNHGVAGVLNKVRKFGTADISSLVESNSEPPPFGFASGNFFASYLAAKEIYDNRAKYFPGLQPEPPLQLTMLKLSRAVTVTEIKNKLGVSEDELRSSNYGISDRIWKGMAAIPAGYNLKVPDRFETPLIKAGFGEGTQNFSVDASARIEPLLLAANKIPKQEFSIVEDSTSKIPAQKQVMEVLKGQIPKSAAEKKKSNSHTVKPGDTLYSIARDFGVSVSALKFENKIKGSSVFVGKVLKIPQATSGKVAQADAPTPKKGSRAALVKLYTVKKGDTLGSVAKRMNVSLPKLLSANGISAKKPNIKVGQVLKIPLG